MLERRSIVLVVDLDLRALLEAADDHVRARSLHAHEPYGHRRSPIDAVRAPPPPLAPCPADPAEWPEVVLLDERRQAVLARPSPVPCRLPDELAHACSGSRVDRGDLGEDPAALAHAAVRVDQS